MSNDVRGYSDEAVRRLSDDSFGVKKYVMGLCEFIKTCNTPMTISIQGDWGSGKTSMMNMIKEQISDSVHPVWFNTWQYSQFNMHDELTVSMLCALLAELKCDTKIKEAIVGNIGKFFKKATKVAVNVAAETYGVDKILKQVTDVMEPNTADFAEEVKKLKEQFQTAVDAVLKANGRDRVVVFVDDLDRLQPAKAVELLEVLKVFLDCENCVYVLAVDYGVVTQGIKQKFGDLVGEEKGRSFFDKIIQLPFKMPVAQYDVKNYIARAFGKMGIDIKESVQEYVDLVQLSIGFNPRSMKRLFNTYQLLSIIMEKSDSEIKNSNKLLFAIICMQMEFERFYEYLVANTLVVRDFLGDGLTDEIKEDIGVDDIKLSQITAFMRKFNEVLQLDDKFDEISDSEIINLQKVLLFSSITSVNGNGAVENDNEKDWKYRRENLKIIEKTNAILNEKYDCIFALMQYKKNKDGRKISDGVGYIEFKDLGFPYRFRYVIRTNYATLDTTLDITIYSTGNSKEREKFGKFFSDTAVQCYHGYMDDEPAWWYENLWKFSSLTCNLPEYELAEKVGKAFEEFREFINVRKVELVSEDV